MATVSKTASRTASRTSAKAAKAVKDARKDTWKKITADGEEAKRALIKKRLRAALAANDWNLWRTARYLGRSPGGVQYTLQKWFPDLDAERQSKGPGVGAPSGERQER